MSATSDQQDFKQFVQNNPNFLNDSKPIHTQNSDNWTNLVHMHGFIPLLIGVLLVTLVYRLYKNYLRRNNAAVSPNVPVLMAYYTRGTDMSKVKEGTLDDLHYRAIYALDLSDPNKIATGALLYIVTLPFAARIHLVGIPKKTGEVQLNPTHGKSVMERVDLEGDYNDYFTLYCDKGMQTETRYVLDPKAMLFTIDFCQQQSWEIVGNELYFVMGNKKGESSNDIQSMKDDIIKFVNEIQPALSRPISEEERQQLTPYGQDFRDDLLCPICNDVMTNTGRYFKCHAGDGVLLSGKELENIRLGKLVLPPSLKKPIARNTPITCPSCDFDMVFLEYEGGKTQIDTCTHCPYRWLDAGEYNLVQTQ